MLSGKPLGRHRIQDLFRKAVRNADIARPGITIHPLRHRFASLLLRNGCDLISAKEMLGNASLESTAIYLDVEMSSLTAAFNRHPLAGAR
jgi:site-specific recombinase XerD